MIGALTSAHHVHKGVIFRPSITVIGELIGKHLQKRVIYKIKLKLRSFKSSEIINEKGDGPYCGFGYLSLFSDPINLATWGQRELL